MVHLTETGGSLTTQPQSATSPITEVEWDGGTLAFRTQDNPQRIFTAHWVGQQLTGQVVADGQTASFVLLPMYAVSEADQAALAGTYRFATGEALTVHVSPTYSGSGLDFFWKGLTITHFGHGAIRGLYPIAPDTFLVGSARVLGYPFVAQITFRHDAAGGITGLDWQSRDSATGQLNTPASANRITLPTETVRYLSSDGIQLTGLLTLPDSPGPHPAIVVLHGSEPGRRDDFFRQELRTFLASEGLAVLTYDKRGVGDSGGVYVERASESNLRTLAEDALAGVAYLSGRSEIDSRHIGLIGSSQSGWIIPLAAQKSSAVAFFIILSGPVVSVGEEGAYSAYTNNGDSDTHYSPETAATAVADSSPSGFDPLPTLAALKQPGLWLWGDHDLSQPVLKDKLNLEKLIAGGQTNLSYLIFANGDHNLQISAHGWFNEIPTSPGYPVDLFTALSAWLKAHS